MPARWDRLIAQEWLVTNGLGGYAAGTVIGAVTRRYHGLLVAALPSGRFLTIPHWSERVHLADGTSALLGCHDTKAGPLNPAAADLLAEFRLESGLPVWRFQVGAAILEKRVFMPYRQNTTFIRYQLLGPSGPVRLDLRPSLHFRPHGGSVQAQAAEHYAVSGHQDRYEVRGPGLGTPLRLHLEGQQATFHAEPETVHHVAYRLEASQGYEAEGSLWSPGCFTMQLMPEQSATLVTSIEPWDSMLARSPEQALAAEVERRQRLLAAAVAPARDGPAAELVLAADQFLIRPPGRGHDAVTVIAGYHWFTDWGRDTMISLPGLALTTGRHAEARQILRGFAQHIRDGLIPNLFPEGEKEGLYHTADATLWYFQALHRYLEVTRDQSLLAELLPKLHDIVRHHQRGTRFGIGVDPADGLLRQCEPGYQLTWMDAKVGDWVVTPRAGKAVEINALWYNALRLLADWATDQELVQQAERVHASFNAHFWNAAAGYLFDVINGENGDDDACRPNQLLAMSLAHPVLDASRWPAVLEAVRPNLLTAVGLRTLSRDHPHYQGQCVGDLRARDAAYHQGTVWAWLIGPFIDAWLRVYPDDRAGARRCLDGLISHMQETCLGTISEIFDGDAPHAPRGCAAQAWSVAEVLRCWVDTAHT